VSSGFRHRTTVMLGVVTDDDATLAHSEALLDLLYDLEE